MKRGDAWLCALLIAVLTLSGCGSPTTKPTQSVTKSRPNASALASTPTATAATTAATFTLSAVGDTIVASAPSYLPPDDDRGLFDDLGTALHSDLQMANLEEPITEVSHSTKCAAASLGTTCFAYRAPTSTATTLRRAGFDLVNLANNHALDYGTAGHAQTETALTAAGVRYTGPPGVIPVLTIRGITVAVIGFAPYPWANNLLSLRADQALIARAKQRAQVVIVQAHMGGEGAAYQHVAPGAQTYLGENRGDVIAFSHAMIDAGADIVIGHGPHVLRAMEFYKGHLIAYSLGNFDGYHALKIAGPTATSVVLRVTLRSDGSFVAGHLVPLTLAPPGLPHLDPAAHALSLLKSLNVTDFPQTGSRISANGDVTPPNS